jgi:AcrR family transcriptional regulator
MARPAHFSTKDRILGAAEELFALHGFAGTSLRQVTTQADVNIAAVNYHFGSKENLVNEVFRRRMDEMTAARMGQLEKARVEHPGELRPVLAAFVEPALAMAQDRQSGGAFVRVIARAYAEKNDNLRRFLSDHYGHVLRDFGRAIAGCVPGLIKRPAAVTEEAHRAQAAQELIHFAEAGFRAAARSEGSPTPSTPAPSLSTQ